MKLSVHLVHFLRSKATRFLWSIFYGLVKVNIKINLSILNFLDLLLWNLPIALMIRFECPSIELKVFIKSLKWTLIHKENCISLLNNWIIVGGKNWFLKEMLIFVHWNWNISGESTNYCHSIFRWYFLNDPWSQTSWTFVECGQVENIHRWK